MGMKKNSYKNETRRVRKGMPAGFLQLETFTLESTK